MKLGKLILNDDRADICDVWWCMMCYRQKWTHCISPIGLVVFLRSDLLYFSDQGIQ